MCRWFDSAPGHHFPKPTVLGWLCRFWAIAKPRGVRADSACATLTSRFAISAAIRAGSTPFCSLFSKNNGEPVAVGTRRCRFKSMSCTCVGKSGSEWELVQQMQIEILHRTARMPIPCAPAKALLETLQLRVHPCHANAAWLPFGGRASAQST